MTTVASMGRAVINAFLGVGTRKETAFAKSVTSVKTGGDNAARASLAQGKVDGLAPARTAGGASLSAAVGRVSSPPVRVGDTSHSHHVQAWDDARNLVLGELSDKAAERLCQMSGPESTELGYLTRVMAALKRFGDEAGVPEGGEKRYEAALKQLDKFLRSAPADAKNIEFAKQYEKLCEGVMKGIGGDTAKELLVVYEKQEVLEHLLVQHERKYGVRPDSADQVYARLKDVAKDVFRRQAERHIDTGMSASSSAARVMSLARATHRIAMLPELFRDPEKSNAGDAPNLGRQAEGGQAPAGPREEPSRRGTGTDAERALAPRLGLREGAGMGGPYVLIQNNIQVNNHYGVNYHSGNADYAPHRNGPDQGADTRLADQSGLRGPNAADVAVNTSGRNDRVDVATQTGDSPATAFGDPQVTSQIQTTPLKAEPLEQIDSGVTELPTDQMMQPGDGTTIPDFDAASGGPQETSSPQVFVSTHDLGQLTVKRPTQQPAQTYKSESGEDSANPSGEMGESQRSEEDFGGREVVLNSSIRPRDVSTETGGGRDDPARIESSNDASDLSASGLRQPAGPAQTSSTESSSYASPVSDASRIALKANMLEPTPSGLTDEEPQAQRGISGEPVVSGAAQAKGREIPKDLNGDGSAGDPSNARAFDSGTVVSTASIDIDARPASVVRTRSPQTAKQWPPVKPIDRLITTEGASRINFGDMTAKPPEFQWTTQFSAPPKNLRANPIDVAAGPSARASEEPSGLGIEAKSMKEHRGVPEPKASDDRPDPAASGGAQAQAPAWPSNGQRRQPAKRWPPVKPIDRLITTEGASRINFGDMTAEPPEFQRTTQFSAPPKNLRANRKDLNSDRSAEVSSKGAQVFSPGAVMPARASTDIGAVQTVPQAQSTTSIDVAAGSSARKSEKPSGLGSQVNRMDDRDVLKPEASAPAPSGVSQAKTPAGAARTRSAQPAKRWPPVTASAPVILSPGSAQQTYAFHKPDPSPFNKPREQSTES